MKSLIIVILFILCVACYDYYLFVQLWPGSWLYHDKTYYNFTNNYFSIHGTWPQNYNGTYPQYCNNKTIFNITKVSNIMPNLTKYWTNFRNTTDFLSHEFSKHLVCTPAPYKLFSIGLILREKYNLYQLFANYDIIPSNEMRYELNKLYHIINQSYGLKVVITCEPNTILNEIRFCMDKTMEFFDCPENLYTEQCNSEMIWYYKNK